jgi:uncharacterized protein
MKPARRFRSFNEYLREKFGGRIQRIALDSGLSCPNRDGTLGTQGCIYCDNKSFNSKAGAAASIREQLAEGAARARRRYGARRFLAYFQTYTNTYAPVELLRALYESVLSDPSIVGMMISTRPDCVPEPMLDLIEDISRRTLVWIELGVQTCHNRTLELIGRGHGFEAAADAIARIKSRGISAAAHVILGLPGETHSDMDETAEALARLKIDGLKLHHLHAVKGTRLAEMWASGNWRPMLAEDYIDSAARFVLKFPENIVMMRLVGDCPEGMLIAPKWDLKKQEIERKIRERIMQAI